MFLITACAAGGFFGVFFSHVVRKIRVYSRAKGWTEVETENDGGGGEGGRQWEKPLAINPLRFLKLRPLFWKQGAAFLIGRQNVNPSADVRFPVGTNFKEVPSRWNAAYLIYVHSKKYSPSVFDTSRKSSAVLKLQRIILKSKRGAVSERKIFLKKEKAYLAHLLAKTTHCVVISWEVCVCSTWFIARIFRLHEVLRF